MDRASPWLRRALPRGPRVGLLPVLAVPFEDNALMFYRKH